ncbi:MAG: PD-(D/E)XK nuclease family protein [bacterium]
MAKDKYTATWVSHSSMGDFLKCPRAYYLKNIYKNPETGKKMSIVSPALSLGLAVHEVAEGLVRFPAEERANQPLLEQFEEAWVKVSGKRGGFKTAEEEPEMKARGVAMIERLRDHLGPLAEKAIKLPDGNNGMPPNYYLSEDDNIILCGKIDWLQYISADDSLRVIDFKTGKHEEGSDSLQLPIYKLLLTNLQKRKVSGAAYWYLDSADAPVDVELPSTEEAYKKVIKVAKQVANARAMKFFDCPKGKEGCFACKPFEQILAGKAEFIGSGEYGQELYLV